MDNDGLIEISSLTELHNMRYDLAGTSYKSSPDADGNSAGCNEDEIKDDARVCFGYELMENLDFDLSGDGRTWSANGDGGHSLHEADSNAVYFPVADGGWLPIGDGDNPFAAVFDGNGHRISNLAIRRDQLYVGFFGVIGGAAAIRNLGLVENLAYYSGSSASNVITYIGGLAAWQDGSITASYATGVAAIGNAVGAGAIGGLVGRNDSGAITASYATGAAAGGGSTEDTVGGLVGQHNGGSITASYATGVAAGGEGSGDYVGGLVGYQTDGSITASYATGVAAGGEGNGDYVGGLVGEQRKGSITASYATGVADGGEGNGDYVGGLVGRQSGGLITASYGFGEATGEIGGSDGSPKPKDVSTAAQLTKENAGSAWNNASKNTLDAWDFGTEEQIPALKYADYDGDGTVFVCGPDSRHFPADACGTLLPGQEESFSAGGPPAAGPGDAVELVGSFRFDGVSIASWSWQQLAGPKVALSDATANVTTFTAPAIRDSLVFELTATASDGRQYTDSISIAAKADRDGDGLLEIDSLIGLHNMRHNLTGTSYKVSATSVGNSFGCPEETGCFGYELMRDLDFDVSGDGRTWSANGDGGYSLHEADSNAVYFPVADGGWLPIGSSFEDPFVAVFDGNGRTIRNLAISRDPPYVGLFGYMVSNAAIRNLGLVDNFAHSRHDRGSAYAGGLVGYMVTGSITASYAAGVVVGNGGDGNNLGGLVGRQDGGMITASYATGLADGGGGASDVVGGLVGFQRRGSITASYATGVAASGNAVGAGGNAVGAGAIGGLVGFQRGGSITASYATGVADGGDGEGDFAGGLVGFQRGGSITASYGFGDATGGTEGSAGLEKPDGVTAASQLTADNAGLAWNDAGSNTLDAWDFGDGTQIPALRYADYDGGNAAVFDCGPDLGHFPAGACGALLPGQDEVSVMGPSAAAAGATVVLAGSLELGRATIVSWSWRQLAGPTVTLSVDNASETTFTAPTADTKEPLVLELTATAADGRQYRERFSLAVATVDRDGNGLIEINDLTELHNMRHNLAGTSYKSGAAAVDNSLGCPEAVCRGYELMRDLDFDADKDGRTWSGSVESGFRLDGDDSQAYYFPVSGRGGGWLPIGGEDDPFAAVFDGNGHTISNLAIGRSQAQVGLFGVIGGAAAIRNLGLVDNLAYYIGSSAGFGAASIGGLVGLNSGGAITESYATGVASQQSEAQLSYLNVGGLVGTQENGGSITASYATGAVFGSVSVSGGTSCAFSNIGGLVGDNDGMITASYATGVVAGGVCRQRRFSGGLVGYNDGMITASYATGAVGGDNPELVAGGLAGVNGGSITASYATGAVSGNTASAEGLAGGLVGLNEEEGVIRASYAAGAVDNSGSIGGSDTYNFFGALVGLANSGSVQNIDGYGFGAAMGMGQETLLGSEKPDGVTAASQLTADNAGPSWDDADRHTLDAWDFGDGTQIPALRYADYDGMDAAVFDCGPDLGHFPAGACGTLLPGQDELSVMGPSAAAAAGENVVLAGSLEFGRATIASWSWRQLSGPEVMLSNDDAREAAFTAPLSKEPMLFELTATDGDGRKYSGRVRIDNAADRDGNGLIEIDGLLDLHNMRHNLAGTGYKSGAAAVDNSLGCPDAVCRGYELMRDLDFDGDDDDGRTWSGNGADGYTLDSDDHQADYFPVDEDGAGGWLPIGDGGNPFAAVFDGNGNSIRGLAIRRDQAYVGLFGAIGVAAAIRGLGLIDNLADYTGSSDDDSYIGGLAGGQFSGSITASYARGPAAGGDGAVDYVGGLVGRQAFGSITASYATGAAAGGDGSLDYVGGLMGQQSGGSITASYATGAAAGGDGDDDRVGGLVGNQSGGSITASYAAGTVSGGAGDSDAAGALVGLLSASSSITESYGFGGATGESEGSAGSEKPDGVTAASQLTATNVGLYWDDAGSNTLGAWDFGDEAQIPALNYADYDGIDGEVFACADFPAGACGALLPGQDQVSASGPAATVALGDIAVLAGSLNRRGDSRVTIVSWSWRQLAGPGVELNGADGREATFTMPLTKEPLLFELTATGSDGRRYRDHLSVAVKADRDGDGLLEIDGLLELHNMRHNLAGTSYKASSSAWMGNSAGCPEDTGCLGYELMRDLDFDGDDADGRTWSDNGADGYTLDSDDHQADYFPVDEDGAGGWLPIGGETNPFVAVFDGNSHTISGLAIRRSETLYVGLFGAIGGNAAIRGLGLIDNLAEYTSSKIDGAYIGGLAGVQFSGSITASWATGVADGGGGDQDSAGGLVGWQGGGSITASYATGAAAGGDGSFDSVGGLMGLQSGGSITASYATGAAAGGDGDNDSVGGLVGYQSGGSITASYATGAADGGDGNDDSAGGLVGQQGGSITASYGFGEATGENGGSAGSPQPPGVDTAAQLTAANAGTPWDNEASNTLGAWDFGDEAQIPALKYADYDGIDGEVFACADFPAGACGALLPGQADVDIIGPSLAEFGDAVRLTGSLKFGRGVVIVSWSWRQLAGPDVALSDAAARAPTFTVPVTEEALVFELTATDADGRQYRDRLSLAAAAAVADRDGDGLIEIHSLIELHNMRHDLTGVSYKTRTASVGETFGCPAETGCFGYELERDLDFDVSGDGRTWSDDGHGGYRLHGEDSNADYFPVADGAGGWRPIGDESNPFAAVFDGNGHTISNLAIRRNERYLGLFGGIEDAAIRHLGLVDNLAHYTGSSTGNDVGGLVGLQTGGSITASYATGAAVGGASNRNNRVGGLVGWVQESGMITASYATGAVAGGAGENDQVGGLVGVLYLGALVTASYATGAVAGGGGNDQVGGLVGSVDGAKSITASYATGAVDGGGGGDAVGGLVGYKAIYGEITASYATGAADGGGGGDDKVGRLVGLQDPEAQGPITASYGFGATLGGEEEGVHSSPELEGVAAASQLTAANAGASWDNAANNTLGAWDFGDDGQFPALKYGDYDEDGAVFACGQFPPQACNTLLPGQADVSASGSAVESGQTVMLAGALKFGRDIDILSWSWRQLAGPTVTLSVANARETTFTAPMTKEYLLFELTATASDGRRHRDRLSLAAAADLDGNGLIEIYSLLELHNMRHDLTGKSYRSGRAAVGNSLGCPAEGCSGYELMRDLDFDVSGDGRTWSDDGHGGYRLHGEDSNADYFPVADGAGGWRPIGDESNRFAAVFDGNGHTISNLAIRRNEGSLGLFGATEDAAIRHLGLVDNLAHYTGSSTGNDVGGLVGQQTGGSITASYATGAAVGGASNSRNSRVGGLVGWVQEGGVITASYATGAVAGGAGKGDQVGGLVGVLYTGASVTASYATGAVAGGGGNEDEAGGLVGSVDGAKSITASYATGAVDGGGGSNDAVGGLVGYKAIKGAITASYATGAVDGGGDGDDKVGRLVGFQHRDARSPITASYGFGATLGGEEEGVHSSPELEGVAAASQLTAANAGASWDNAANNTLGAWDFGDDGQIPALKYGDYDDEDGAVFACGQFPPQACNTLLPGQADVSASGSAVESGQTVMLAGALKFGRDIDILSWSWRQLAGPTVTLSVANARETTFTAPMTKEYLLFELTATASDGRRHRDRLSLAAAADLDGNGLIEIYSLLELHNMRHDLTGKSYRSGRAAVGNSLGCPAEGCGGYELMRDLDFDVNGDGRTWSEDGDGGYRLHGEDSNADYFPVAGGAGGWRPIGDSTDNGFAAVFDGNSHTISNLATSRDLFGVGFFGHLSGAAIRNLGLVDNLAHYASLQTGFSSVGGLAGLQDGGSITASYATGVAAVSGNSVRAELGGLVGRVFPGVLIMASYATGAVSAVGSGSGGGVIGGLVGVLGGSTLRASYATAAVSSGPGDGDYVGGLVGDQGGGEVTMSYATGTVVDNGGDGDSVGGLVGHRIGGLFAANYATGAVVDNSGDGDRVGGLVGFHGGGSITASYATGAVVDNGGNGDDVGGLVGLDDRGTITACYATGAVGGGAGADDNVGGLVGRLSFPEEDDFSLPLIAASYATGDADGGAGDGDNVGGLVGSQQDGTFITASYATGDAVGGSGVSDSVGALVGSQSGGSITESYGFGGTLGGKTGLDGSPEDQGIGAAVQLTAANAGASWDHAGSNTLNAWDFGNDAQIPALKYADYDDGGARFACSQFPQDACGALLPGQDEVSAGRPAAAVNPGDTVLLTGSLKYGRVAIASWSWRQLSGPGVALSDAAARETAFTAPLSKEPLVFELTATDGDGRQHRDRLIIAVAADRDGDGLIEIDSLLELHNMRYNLSGTGYKSGPGPTAFENNVGCPSNSCIGYELMQHLDFDGDDDDGGTWSGNGADGYTLDSDDHQADYFPVDEDGAGGWLPIGDGGNPFAAVFDGNGHRISNLAIRRNQSYVGLFGFTSGAVIRNIGLVDNLADYSGSSSNKIYIGGLVGRQSGGSITASYATGAAAGGGGSGDRVGGLVGSQSGLITASYATGGADGGDGESDYVGGLVGLQTSGSITASYATGSADGGANDNNAVGGLVGWLSGGTITASYATGAVVGSDDDGGNYAGGLVGAQSGGSITASYATGPADGSDYGLDVVGSLVGSLQCMVGGDCFITESYGFGETLGGKVDGYDGSPAAKGIGAAAQLTAVNAGSAWNDAGSNTLGAWDFGDGTQIPALNYADYDGDGDVFGCDPNPGFPANVCDTLLPGQDEASVDLVSSVLQPGGIVKLVAGSPRFGRIEQFASFSWRQLAGPEVALSDAAAREAAFTAPKARDLLVFELTATDSDGRQYRARISLGVDVDRNDNGLIDIDSLLDLHNMRHNLKGTSYKTGSTTSVGNSFGCPDRGCMGYELMQHLDFDGDDDDGGTWSGNGADGYTLDSDDHQADYFPVDEDGAGGWLPIGDGDNPFTAVFDGNGNSISNLAIRRSETFYVGLFGAIGGNGAIRGLGLIDNLADYSGSSPVSVYIGGLAGFQGGSSITASYATGPAVGGDGGEDHVGGLVGMQNSGSITASYATGAADGGDGDFDYVGGLVGLQEDGPITASYATGAADGGDGGYDYVGGLVGLQSFGGSITAGYATGAVGGGGGGEDSVGGLVGLQEGGSITASYAIGTAAGGEGDNDSVGALVGLEEGGSITASYGFGVPDGEVEATVGRHPTLDSAVGLTEPGSDADTAAGTSWNAAESNTLGAWDFGDGTQIPALNYADYDGIDGGVFACADFPADACGTLLSGQRYAVLVSVARLEVDEGGSASYSLRLASTPTGRVEVRVVVPFAYRDSLRASPASLFFDGVAEGQAEHWGTDQRVTLSLEEDGLSSGTRVVTVKHRVTSEDLNYQGLEVPGVEVALIDDEKRPELILTLSPDNAAEGSSSDPSEETSQNVVRVRVTAGLEGPARSVDTVVALTVGVASDSAGEDEYRTDLPADATLIIPAAATASEPLVVVVTLFQDRIDEGDRSFTITAFADVLDAASATFVITDDDRAGVAVTLTPQSVREGGEISYNVVLTSEPAADVEVAVTVEPVAGSEVVLTKVELNKDTLTFDSDNWYEPQTVTLTVEDEVTVFGGLDINHRLTSTDANYAGLTLDAIRLELVDVDASLQSLELRLAAAGELLVLLNADGDDIDFSAHVRQYFATVPFPAASAFITATPSVMEEIVDEQEKGRVRIFRENDDGTLEALGSGADVAGTATEVNLPEDENTFDFLIEVSARPLPLADGEELTRQTYTLTLTRALPADAELRVYRAADGERETPITDLDFGPDDDDMDLILILSRGGGGSGYSIRDIGISGSDDDRFAVTNGGQIDTGAGGFETPVTLRRVDVNAAEDVPYSLTFTATPEHPPADDANLPSATIAGTLKANSDTETEIQATYRGEDHEGEEASIFPDAVIRVSDNGPVTIQLRVARSGGGERNFGQSDFSLLVTVAGEEAPAVPVEECDCYSLEIPASGTGPLSLTVAAKKESSLGARISTPPALAFTLSFESPRAVIRPAVGPNPLLAFRKPFFAFVGEGRRLPLEVVLAADSTPLPPAAEKRIIDALDLNLEEGAPAGVALDAGRVLKFNVEGPKNNVEITVSAEDEEGLADVETLTFRAHFLSLKHPDGIEFRGDVKVFDIVLQGEDPDNDSWTFERINTIEFESHGYQVEEVALTGTESIYEPSTAESAAETRHLRVTGDATAVNSRIVLEFKYLLDGEAAGVFTRVIKLTSGREASLEVAVIPGTLVLPKGGSGQVRLLVSNLAPEQDPTGFILLLPDHADVTAELQGSGRLDPINNRFEQTLEVRAAADAGRPEYTVRVEVRLPGRRAVGTEFRVDINDAPQYKGETELIVYESGHGSVLEFPLSIVDPDGGMRFLDATELYLEVIGFEDSFKVASNDGHANRYFDLAFSGISAVGQEGPPNGKRNSLALTLTLSGKLATPFNSIVELRLFGVTDGFNDFEQRLTVGVKNRPPQFELAETLGVKVFLEREPTAIPLKGLEEGAKVLVLQAPADLVVKFDETAMEVTLRRLDTDLDGNDLSNEVELVALDAQGGRTPVTIEIQRPLRLPRIVPPPPLLLAAGQSGTLQLQLAADTGLNVTWTIAVADSDDLDDFIGEDYELTKIAGGHAELRLTLADSVVAGDEFDLLVTAFVGEEAGGYRRTARLPVLVVAETAKPHLKLRAVSDPTGAAMVVSSFALGEPLSFEVELEGEVPAIYEGDDATAPSFQISIFKLDASGVAVVDPIMDVAESKVVDGELKIDSVVFGEERIAELSLSEGDAVRVSVGLPPDSTGVSDEIIAGASLVLRVSEKAVKDVDNDGLADDTGEDTVPEILGPIAAAVAGVTASGVASAGTGIAVSLSLGETSRLLGLGECGGVSLTLTLTLSEDGAAASLSGCSGAAIDAGPLFAAETLVALGIEEDEEYRLFDLSATFDSSEAGGGGFLVISLPLDPQQPYVVYRYDEDGNDGNGGWVPVEAAGLPGQAGLGGGGQGALADFESDCGSCFYAFDLDRDGALQLLLLLVPMDPEPGSGFALSAEHASLEGRHIEISGDKTETIALVGFGDLAVRITGAATEGANPNIEGRVLDDGTVELIGLKRTANGPEELLIEAFAEDGRAVATISLYVRVPNQPPEVRFMLPSGEELTTTIFLAANSETLLTVMVEDLADGDQSFVLDLMDEDGKVANGRGVASLVSRLSLGVDEGSDYMISHELTLSSIAARAGEFEVKLRVTDLGDGSQTFKTLSVCVLNGSGQCPAPARSGGGGGGGGGTGLLWLLFAAPAALCRDTRLRQRLAAVHNRQRGC